MGTASKSFALVIVALFLTTYTLGFANAMPLPPKISILSPDNQGIYTNEVPLTFTAQTYGTFDTDGRKEGGESLVLATVWITKIMLLSVFQTQL